MNAPKDTILKLPTAALDVICNALADKPWREVVGVMNMIQSQANDTALQAYGPPPPVTVPEPRLTGESNG